MTETTTPQTMLDLKGADYVAAWPLSISRRAGLTVLYVPRAVSAVTGVELDEHISRWLGEAGPIDEIGAMTPATATAVVAELDRIRASLAARRATSCHYCGLPLNRDSECDECGPNPLA
jgi:hypothetical protein